MPVFGQALLKRREGSTKDEFKRYYIEHHARLVLPYFLDCGVEYYAQVAATLLVFTHVVRSLIQVQIHNLHWISPAAQAKNLDVDLTAWDAAAECTFGPRGPPCYRYQY